MFCSRASNNMINKIHERALRLILNCHTSDRDTLLQNNNDTCNHHRKIQTLMAEIYKKRITWNLQLWTLCLERQTPRIMSEIFKSLRQKEIELHCKNGSWNFKLQISAVMVNFTYKETKSLLWNEKFHMTGPS